LGRCLKSFYTFLVAGANGRTFPDNFLSVVGLISS
jgi:hypothetical protein